MIIGAGMLRTQNVSHLREVNVKRTIFIIVLFLLFLMGFFYYSKPIVIIHNKTSDDVFVFFGTSERGIEPDYEQIKQSRRALKIPHGKSIEVSISVADYFLRNGQVNIGWRVGGIAMPAIKRVGYSTFNIMPGTKYCTLGINIYNDKDEAFYQDNSLCIKSLEVDTSADN